MSKLKKALERAKTARNNNTDFLYPDDDSKELNAPKHYFKPMDKEELNVSYSKTKTIDIDSAKLRENKIFSHIKENGMAEQISILRTRLLNRLEEIGGNTLMVTSSHPGEGKTFLSINLGVSIAQELNRTVLIVDCDLRHPDTTHYDFTSDFFGIERGKGLSDYLLGQAEIEDVLVNPGIKRLTILPGGKPLSNSAELLSSSRMKMLVEEMKNRYGNERIIIFDSPSILKISDPLAFSRFVDGILLVVEVNRSSKSDVKKVMDLLKDRVIIGTVLNKVKN